MRNSLRILAFAAAAAIVALSSPAWADNSKSDKKKDPPKVSETPSKIEAVPNDPQLTTATFGDWVERCQRVASGEPSRVCEVAQTFTVQGQSAPIAQLAIGRLHKGDPLRLTLMLPVNVAFPSAPKIAIRTDSVLELAWRRCVPAGCFAEAAISDADLGAMRAASDPGQAEFKTSADQDLKFAVSFRGFSQALDALTHEN